MRKEKIVLWESGEYDYPKAGTFIPAMYATLHDNNEKHPVMMVVPGGGYVLESAMEAGNLANKFYEWGYDAFVLVYTNNLTMDTPVLDQPVKDIARAVRIIRCRAEEYGIDPEKVFAVGCSAGGHLVGSLALKYDWPKFEDRGVYAGISAKLTGAVLVYPLLSDKNAPSDTRVFVEMMTGSENAEAAKEDFRLENHIRKDASPMCIFACAEDDAVGCLPSADFMLRALNEGMSVEYHLFNKAGHGFAGMDSTPEEIAESDYVYDQMYGVLQGADDDTLEKMKDCFVNLNKDMTYEEFISAVGMENIAAINSIMLDKDWEELLAASADYRMDIEIWFDITKDWLDSTFS